ncbi:protein FAM83D [Dunckerocampus dactyliophorus]|uniref:protein FAM83D n=1 Tax=Dunckerocampus dactyliophorus TaxID=161453 RepID=UPI002405A4F8|nr:protein FAM83D [Dunckerocampus dactyliophorus]
MALSQCLEDSPLRVSSTHRESNIQEVYNERHRLALEELLSGGVDNFLDFLRKEDIANFLSDEEIQRILGDAVAPRCVSFLGEDQALEQSLSSSMDCSSVTYFPEVSDVEPPPLEIGWPAFTAGSYRGVTRAVAHFQPSYGESIYACKEAVRNMISSAREVIAIVTDSLTDLDIFKDLQEACSARKVPVYVLLDRSSCPSFLKMCRNIGVCLDDLQQMRVRTITGTTYYTRSGARITGRVHERFMLIDGIRAATGSYRFDWTDGKLNTSNLIELSGQITEKFDEEFRILYAQSLPINTRAPPSVRNSGIFEHIPTRHLLTSSPYLRRERPVELVRVTGKLPASSPHPHREASAPEAGKSVSAASDKSTTSDDWSEQKNIQEEVLAGALSSPAERPAESELAAPNVVLCHVATQASLSVADGDTQTDLHLARNLGLAPDIGTRSQKQATSPSQAAPAGTLKDCLHNLTKERQHHYSAIRSKLEHMMAALSQRRELADMAAMTRGRQAVQKDMLWTDPGLGVDQAMVKC